jgi:hypothetical protein
MLTFAEARALVAAELAPGWPSRLGTFHVRPTGYEDDRAWLVVVGAREWLVDGDEDFVVFDAPAILVDKRTGRIERLVVIEHLDRLGAMQPVSF